MSDDNQLFGDLISLGLNERKAEETLKNVALCKTISNALLFVPCGYKFNYGEGQLIYQVCTKIKQQSMNQLDFLVRNILERKLDTVVRVDSALKFLLANGTNKEVDVELFEKACGVGVVVTPEEIDRTVESAILRYKESIEEQRYRFNVGKLLAEIRGCLPWADGKAIKNEVDVQLFDLLGPKTEADKATLVKADKKSEAKKNNVRMSKVVTNGTVDEKMEYDGAKSISELMKSVHFHAPGENHKTDGYVITDHTSNLLKEHLSRTGGLVRTRFPPEPNGILHIGHAKAININFGYAKANNGVCLLRYDDTNPEKEEEKFFIGIKEMVEWLGYQPYKITHSSDYFQQLYEWAVILIKKGFAYVCHQKADAMKGFNPELSKWRNRAIDESLKLFEDMKNGKIDEGAATLRMKITLEEGKVDPVAYRIKFIEHHRTGNNWCIYPTYDYTHCLCDSIEDITHSLCTKEFQSRRSSYYWLCNTLDIYCPVQWEYGRLNVNYTVVSKRKIAKLITKGIVKDWDDPRLFTLTALRRRGFPTEAINSFCAQMGVTGAQSSVDPSALEASVRDVLNITAPRALVVLEPLKITITNFPYDAPVELTVPNFPSSPEKGTHTIWLDRILYIERSDFKENPEKGYRRLTTCQSVGLRYAGLVISVSDVLKNSDGCVTELVCKCDYSETTDKPKAFVQWVSQPNEIEVRLYEKLFKHKNPEDTTEVPGGYLSDCNPESLKIISAYGDIFIKTARVFDKYQFERIGYFSVDPDSSDGHLVFNRTVGLKEDGGKN
ncbi:probable glutamine--tRNA ligase [Topomyia yanbarensis]|uniref:probable glutamine--tRNA ligase n=1 Tax=Topomyia yanbarensis TaxID=2498891 RepID=UPI00273B4519|nr:probable glutamine--tRNA ligase [Topomyia yanbarensis]